MQPKITRYLKAERADRQGLQKIHMRVCWSGMKVRFSTGESVNPDHWYQGTDDDDDEIRGRVTKAGGITGKNINRRLSIYTSELEKYFDSRLTVPRPEEVQTEIERIRTQCLGHESKAAPVDSIPETPGIPTLPEFIKIYNDDMRADRSDSWREMLSVIGKHLAAFRSELAWSQLTLPTLNQFKVYLQEEMGHSDATLRSYVGVLRGMLKYAGRSGVPVPADWSYLEVRKGGDAIMPELRYSELVSLADAKFDRVELGSESMLTPAILEETRWYFMVACGTGVRHSDLWQMQSPSILKIEGIPCVEIYQQKTNQRVPVPLNEETYDLIKHPAKKRPEPLYVYNKALKTISKAAELNRTVMVGSYYGGNLLSEYLPLYETVNSHMARRTYATLMTSGGMPTRALQVIMGHSSISSTERYAKIPSKAIVQQAVESWKRSKEL
jgi:integrase